MPLFVSNTLMRAVKLSNSLPLPSGTNNGTFNLAVLSDINKHSHKGSRRVPETPRAVHKQEKRKKDDTHTNTTLNTHTEEEKKREEDRDRFVIFNNGVPHVDFCSLAAYRGQCCSVTVMVVPLYFNSIKQDLTTHLSQGKTLKKE